METSLFFFADRWLSYGRFVRWSLRYFEGISGRFLRSGFAWVPYDVPDGHFNP